MNLAHAACTDVGLIRSANEDYFRIVPELALFILTDGMGGARGGGYASKLSADTVAEEMLRVMKPDASSLLAAVDKAHLAVRSAAALDPALGGMGTTLVAVLAHDQEAAVVSVGDSRAYRFGQKTLELITEDQTWVREVGIPLGLTEEALRTHPMRNRLTMAVGIEAPLEAQYYSTLLAAGSGILICSDGLHGLIRDKEISEIVNGSTALNDRCARLIHAAREAGGTDNITAVLIEAL